MIEESLQEAIQLVHESVYAYCHYITPNDVGATGGHQYGFTFAKPCYKMFFDEPGEKGSNKENFVEVDWQKGLIKTKSRAIYYGVGTRNEYRLTRFGNGFEFLCEEYIGSLQIMTKNSEGEYFAYVLSNQDNIESFMDSFSLDVTKGNQVIDKVTASISPNQRLENDFMVFINEHTDFPDTTEIAKFVRKCIIAANGYTERFISEKSDSIIMEWTDAEYQLFRGLEEKIYRPVFTKPFENCQSLVEFSNSILNRRKSRAGKSLEHHLAEIFTASHLRFDEQVVTENNKKPDFIFPDGQSYHNFMFPSDKLTMLGAKTTCKDRWRQVLNEADRIPNKHLFTLQRGVTRNQLQEMRDERLTLVVPKDNKSLFLPEFHDNIMCLSEFIGMVRERQN
ncbi:MAG: restriction endonuclease [Bacteroidaceae bacterium]|nr:restriction endonuclease [Bacteroidaceae bacterium]